MPPNNKPKKNTKTKTINNDLIIKTIVDLINTSPDHNAWLDEHKEHVSGEDYPGFGDGKSRIHIAGPKVDRWMPNEIFIKGTTIHIGHRKFDLQNPKSINQIEEIFGGDVNREPAFDLASAICSMIHHRKD